MPSASEYSNEWTSRSHPVQEEMDFQRAWWRAERIAWLCMAVAVVLALLGFFSNGVFGTGTAMSESGRLQVEYGRVERKGAVAQLMVEVAARPSPEVRLRIGAEFAKAFTFEGIVPQPYEEVGGSNGVEMRFRAAAGQPLKIHFSLRPSAIGPVRGDFAIAGEPPVRFTQFVLP